MSGVEQTDICVKVEINTWVKYKYMETLSTVKKHLYFVTLHLWWLFFKCTEIRTEFGLWLHRSVRVWLWTDDLIFVTSCLRPCLHTCSHLREKKKNWSNLMNELLSFHMKSWPMAGWNVSHVAQAFPPPYTCSSVPSSVGSNGMYCNQPYRPVTRPSHRTASSCCV